MYGINAYDHIISYVLGNYEHDVIISTILQACLE